MLDQKCCGYCDTCDKCPNSQSKFKILNSSCTTHGLIKGHLKIKKKLEIKSKLVNSELERK